MHAKRQPSALRADRRFFKGGRQRDQILYYGTVIISLHCVGARTFCGTVGVTRTKGLTTKRGVAALSHVSYRNDADLLLLHKFPPSLHSPRLLARRLLRR